MQNCPPLLPKCSRDEMLPHLSIGTGSEVTGTSSAGVLVPVEIPRTRIVEHAVQRHQVPHDELAYDRSSRSGNAWPDHPPREGTRSAPIRRRPLHDDALQPRRTLALSFLLRRHWNLARLRTFIIRDEAWCIWFAGHPPLQKSSELCFGLDKIRIN